MPKACSPDLVRSLDASQYGPLCFAAVQPFFDERVDSASLARAPVIFILGVQTLVHLGGDGEKNRLLTASALGGDHGSLTSVVMTGSMREGKPCGLAMAAQLIFLFELTLGTANAD